MLSTVAHSIADYLVSTNVQMANYPLAHTAAGRVALGNSAAAVLLGAESVEDVMLGQSATSLVASLSTMLEQGGTVGEGDEVVVSDADHETNRGAWIRLAERSGCKVKHWPVTPMNSGKSDNVLAVHLDPKVLQNLVTERTKVVAFTACSNLLGHFTDIASAAKVVRSIAPHALICVDCVAFAPHRRMTPRNWDVDVAFFSLYKTYGAHIGAMWINPKLKERGVLKKLNHFFLHEGKGMYPYQSSSVQYELNYSIAAVADYLVGLGSRLEEEKVDWNAVFTQTSEKGFKHMSRSQVDTALENAFGKIAGHETALLSALIPFLLSYREKGVRIVGPEESDSSTRAPTVAFVIIDPASGQPKVGTSKAIHTALVEGGKVGAQQGHMYAHKLVSSLGLDLDDGVVRLSFVHYNTEEEVQRVVGMLKEVFDKVL